MDTHPPHHQALSRAKVDLMSRTDAAFFTTVCFSLKHVWDETIPTACTDGTEIRFNPQFFLQLRADERVFLLLHEAMHVAYLHMDRLQSRDRRRWNIAADHVINLMLIERGYRMPEGGLADPQYKGLSTEEVYARLPEAACQDIPVELDLVEPSGDPAELGNQVEDILMRAAIQSKMQNDTPGTIPGEIQIFLDNLLEPRLPWQRILQKFLFTQVKNDYTWRRPNRRYFPRYVLPSLYNEGLGHLAVAIDTSGSVSNEDFHVFVSEVASILRMMKPEKLTLLQFDTCIKSVDTLHQVSDLYQVEFRGRGGTEIEPVMSWVQENQPQLMLVFTDGHFRFYDARPPSKAPLLWVIHNNPGFSPPFGKTIFYGL